MRKNTYRTIKGEMTMANDLLDDEIGFVVEAVHVQNTGLKGKIAPDAESVWFNYTGVDVESIRKKLGNVRVGDTIVLTLKGNKYTDFVHVPNNNSSSEKDDYDTLPVLLSRLKKETDGQYSIETKILDMNLDKGYAVVQAMVKGCFGTVVRDGKDVDNARWSTCHGDCTQVNGGMVKMHFIRMAESRAIARALRMVLGGEE
jgi:hypothetical protein